MTQALIDQIREAFLYQSRFTFSTVVLKVEFSVTETPGFPYLMKDIALLVKTGLRVVIVPGAQERIDALLAERGLTSEWAGPHRVTTKEAIPYVEMAAIDVAGRFISALSAARVDAVIGNFVRARGLGVVDGVDTAHTGKVDKVFVSAIRRILEIGAVTVLPCIGWSPVGKPYNVLSNEIALAVSRELGAEKLIVVGKGNCLSGLASPEGVERDEEGRIVRLSPAEAECMLETASKGPQSGPETAENRPSRVLDLALRACKAGVERVHLVDGCEEGVILRELFSNMGAGTMIYADEYESIRPIKHHDIPDLLRIMQPLMDSGVLIRRTAEQIQKQKDDYVVFEVDGAAHACGALHDWGEGQAEIAAIAADSAWADRGLGTRVVRFLIDRARKNSFGRVFVLTTMAQDWFEALGFAEVSVGSLPTRKREAYNYARNSKVFALEL